MTNIVETQQAEKTAFFKALRPYLDEKRRVLPWRILEPDGQMDPYRVLVSEMMLQQTQVGRVVPKFVAFLEAFPTLEVLAEAKLAGVLKLWSGLGYNRRAKYVHDAATRLVGTRGQWSMTKLADLRGIGHNTAAAIRVYSYDTAEVFVETNIRTVYIHHFFAGQGNVADTSVVSLLKATLPSGNYRQFYWALMDYGTVLKAEVGNASRQSRHFSKQSRFEGSRRQLRGQVIRELTDSSGKTIDELELSLSDARLQSVLDTLVMEGLLHLDEKAYHFPV